MKLPQISSTPKKNKPLFEDFDLLFLNWVDCFGYAQLFYSGHSFGVLSGCGEKDPAKKFLGRYNAVGQTERGIVISEDKTGFLFFPEAQREFTWLVNSDGKSVDCETETGGFTVYFDGSFLVAKDNREIRGKKNLQRYERAK